MEKVMNKEQSIMKEIIIEFRQVVETNYELACNISGAALRLRDVESGSKGIESPSPTVSDLLGEFNQILSAIRYNNNVLSEASSNLNSTI